MPNISHLKDLKASCFKDLVISYRSPELIAKNSG